MDRFDIVGALRTYAASKGWHFIYGSRDYQSADFHSYTTNQLVLIVEIEPSAMFSEGGAVQSVDYNGVIMLGRKFEALTESNLDETMLQKYDNRLKDLWSIAYNSLGAFACTNRMSIETSSPATLINMLSVNIDFVSFNVKFSE